MDYRRLKEAVRQGDATAAERLATEALRKRDFGALFLAAALLAKHNSSALVLWNDARRVAFLANFPRSHRHHIAKLFLKCTFQNPPRPLTPELVVERVDAIVSTRVNKTDTPAYMKALASGGVIGASLTLAASLRRSTHEVVSAHGFASWCIAWSRMSEDERDRAKALGDMRGGEPATAKQIALLERFDFIPSRPLTKREASRQLDQILKLRPVSGLTKDAVEALGFDASTMTQVEAERLVREHSHNNTPF